MCRTQLGLDEITKHQFFASQTTRRVGQKSIKKSLRWKRGDNSVLCPELTVQNFRVFLFQFKSTKRRVKLGLVETMSTVFRQVEAPFSFLTFADFPARGLEFSAFFSFHVRPLSSLVSFCPLFVLFLLLY